MVSDQERREVAGRMRAVEASEFKDSPIVPFLDCLGVGYTNWVGVMGLLAELIDRPTCRNEYGSGRSFFCSACGCDVWTYDDSYCDPSDFSFCPNCGAEVVHDG